MTTDPIPGTPGETGETGATGARGRAGAKGDRGQIGQRGPEGGATPALAATLSDLARAVDKLGLRSLINGVTTAINALAVVLLVFVLLQLSDTAGNTNRILYDVESVTGSEARKTQADATQALVDNLITVVRRSIDCSGFYFDANPQDQRPPACVEVDARLDLIHAGGDPFTHPTTTTTRP